MYQGSALSIVGSGTAWSAARSFGLLDRAQQAILDRDGTGEHQRAEAPRVPGDEEGADKDPQAVAHDDHRGAVLDGLDQGRGIVDEPVDGGHDAPLASLRP